MRQFQAAQFGFEVCQDVGEFLAFALDPDQVKVVVRLESGAGIVRGDGGLESGVAVLERAVVLSGQVWCGQFECAILEPLHEAVEFVGFVGFERGDAGVTARGGFDQVLVGQALQRLAHHRIKTVKS